MIEIEHLERTFGQGAIATSVLRDISFRIAAGELVTLMGASGTGKSTLLNILGGLDKPTAGRYRLAGTEVLDLDDDALSQMRNRRIGFVFQQFHLLARATALRNVLLPLIYAEQYPTDAENRARELLATVGLADRFHYRPGELSGGQQQRVAIARALITDPAIVLADEPTGNLDRKSGLEILAIFQRLHRDGRTLLIVTHDIAIAEHADRILVMREGRVTEDRPVPHPRNAERELEELGQTASEPSSSTTPNQAPS